MKSLLDELEPVAADAAKTTAENISVCDMDKRELITVTLSPGEVKDRYMTYEKHRRYIIDVLSSAPNISCLNVHEEESLIGYPLFIFDFKPDFNTFADVLRLFRTLFSLIAYLKKDSYNQIEKSYIYLNRNDEEFPPAYHVSSPRGSMRQFEEIGEKIFRIRRPKHNLSYQFGYGYRLMFHGRAQRISAEAMDRRALAS